MKLTLISFILLAFVLIVLHSVYDDGKETQAKPSSQTRSTPAPSRSGDADAARNLKF